jgi:sugar phosphate isomerase/epimerase
MKLSLFSISYAGLWGQAAIDLPQFIRRAADLGFDSVMIAGKRPHLSPLDMREQQVTELASALQAARLECPVIAAYTDFGGTVAAEVPYMELQLAYIESLCAIGQQLGASILRVFTAYEISGHSPEGTWRKAVGCLREACDRAATYQMTVAIQNHHDIGVHTSALLEFLSDVDRSNCKLGFDAWSPGLRGEDLYEAARAAAVHTVITTNADYIRLPRYRYRPELVNYEAAGPDMVRAVPFGTGFLDYRAFFSGLSDGGFKGIATYEMCSPIRGGGSLENLDCYAQTYLRWMRENT